MKKPPNAPPEKRASRTFSILALAFGSIFALLTPPFQSPDEQNHFFRAFQVANGQFFPRPTTDNRLGCHLPESLDSLRRAFIFLKNDYDAKTSFSNVYAHLGQVLSPEKTKFVDFPNTAIYAPTAYFPQAFAIFVFKNSGASPLVLLLAARLANLLFWVWLLCNALKTMPLQTRAMAFLALLPASLAISSSCNADVLTNGLCFWLVAVLLSRKFENGPAMKLGAILAAAIVALNKIVFAPLVLLVFFRGEGFEKLEKGGSQLKHNPLIFKALLLTTTFCAAIFWAKISSNSFIPFDKYNPEFREAQTLNEGVDPGAQIRFVLEKPLFFAQVMAESYWKSLPSTAAHLVGKFGWEKNYLPVWSLFSLWAALILLVFSEKTAISHRLRMVSVAVGLLCGILFSVTMYALWCPVASPELTNLQGRYFVPVLPLLALAFGGAWCSKWAEKIWFFALSALLLGLASLAVGIVQRYYS